MADALAVECAYSALAYFRSCAEEAVACFGALYALVGFAGETCFTADFGDANWSCMVGAGEFGRSGRARASLQVSCRTLRNDYAAARRTRNCSQSSFRQSSSSDSNRVDRFVFRLCERGIVRL